MDGEPGWAGWAGAGGDPPHDPLVAAVVHVRPEAEEATGGVAAEDPTAVASQAAAILSGGGVPASDVASGPGGPTDVTVPEQGSALARVKGYFTRAGFEVHAPVGTSFSIAAPRSRFEELFGERLVVDQERLLSPVTTADGGDALPLDRLPDEVQALVGAVSLPPPPELPPGLL